MPITQSITCDAPGCDAVKGEANHWFVVVSNPSGFAGQPLETFDDDGTDVVVAVVCGESCALKMVSWWFAVARGAAR